MSTSMDKRTPSKTVLLLFGVSGPLSLDAVAVALLLVRGIDAMQEHSRTTTVFD